MQALGGLLGSKGAKKAAKQREQAMFDAMGIVGRSYNDAEDRFGNRLSQEEAAMGRVNALLGLEGGDGSDPTEILRNTPGYEWQLDQGTEAINRARSATGGLASGNTLTALMEYGQGLADQSFGNYLSMVLGLQNQGVDATLAGMDVDEGNTLANLRVGAGDARASGTEGSTAAWSGALAGGANMLSEWGSQRQWQDLLGKKTPSKVRLPGMLPGASGSSAYGSLPTIGRRLV